MRRRVLLLVVFVLMEVLFMVATAAPALAASQFGAPPPYAPGNLVRIGTANEHDTTVHQTGRDASCSNGGQNCPSL